jgi:hypothetical protein
MELPLPIPQSPRHQGQSVNISRQGHRGRNAKKIGKGEYRLTNKPIRKRKAA